MFEFLQHKKQYFEKEADLECGLVFDKMGITPIERYVASTGSYIGKITFSNEKGIASHVMVFMFVGTVNQWKSVIEYHFTESSCKSTSLFTTNYLSDN